MTTFFLAVCHDCQPVLPVPFSDEAERDKWLEAHVKGTGHHVSPLIDVRE